MKSRPLVRGLRFLQFVGLIGLACAFVSAEPDRSAASSERLYVSGRDRDDAVRWDFRCSTDGKAGEWSTIPVPSNWEMHGFGTLSYHKDLPADVGEYRHRFQVPAAWAGRRVFLVFAGAMTDTKARLNGQQVGAVHRGGFYQFKYEVTPLVRSGAENVLEVTVAETSADASVNRAERNGDYWNFGGIFRPVWLEAVPAQFVERLAIDARADGTLNVDTVVNGQGGADQLVAQVRQLDGAPVGKPFEAAVNGSGDLVRLQAALAQPRLWTAETPNLYQIEVELRAAGKIVHRLTQRFGFRTFEMRQGDGFYLNGQRIVLQGANRHSFHPESGRCLSEKDHREDIRLMQEMNMNAVRMSHYPPDQRFLELCDELGLYVLDELAGWQKFYSEEAGRPLVAETVQRDVNHPSILFWDNGNEGGWQTALDADYHKWDPQQRPILHPWDVFRGINTAHYRNYDQTVEMSAGRYSAKRRNGQPLDEKGPFIYMPTEFLHALYDGGAGAGMEDYWNVMRNSPYIGGGFIWALVDEGVKRPDTGKIDVQGNLAPDGILGPYREKEGSFYTIKELWSPVVILAKALPVDFNGSLPVENRYSFTDLAQCKFTWELRRLPAAHSTSPEVETLHRGSVQVSSIKPGTKGVLQLALPNEWKDAHVLALRVDDPNGREVWTWTWPLPASSRLSTLLEKHSGRAVLETRDDAYVVKTGEFVYEFSRSTGRLARVQRGQRTYSLSDGPRVAVGDAKLVEINTSRRGEDVVITARYDGALKTVEWIVDGSGTLRCEYAYTAEKPSVYLGVTFDYPEARVKSKRWVGYGPYRVWQNRLRGVSLGAWSNDYNDTITGHTGWVYPEFKGCFAGVKWMTLETDEGPVTVAIESDELYLQVLTPSFPSEEDQKASVVRLPKAGLAFLHVIPAVGEKFHPAEGHGPQSQLQPVKEIYRGKVSFRFGEWD